MEEERCCCQTISEGTEDLSCSCGGRIKHRSEKEYKDLCDEVANMQHKRGVAR